MKVFRILFVAITTKGQTKILTLNFIKMKTLTELTSAAIKIVFLSLASVAITGILGGIYFLISELSKF